MKCPCGSGAEYAHCCEPFHKGEQTAPTAEKLMRSRYSAFAVSDFQYLNDTLDPQTFDQLQHPNPEDGAGAVEFVGLEIIRAEEVKNKATVEFRAHFRKNGIELVHHEISRFRQQGGVWYYREGKILET